MYIYEDVARELQYSATHGYPKNAEKCIAYLMDSLSGYLKKYSGTIDKDDLRGLLWDCAMNYGRIRPKESFLSFLNKTAAFYIGKTSKKPTFTDEEALEASAFSGNSLRAFRERNNTSEPEKIAVERAGRRRKVDRMEELEEQTDEEISSMIDDILNL